MSSLHRDVVSQIRNLKHHLGSSFMRRRFEHGLQVAKPNDKMEEGRWARQIPKGPQMARPNDQTEEGCWSCQLPKGVQMARPNDKMEEAPKFIVEVEEQDPDPTAR